MFHICCSRLGLPRKEDITSSDRRCQHARANSENDVQHLVVRQVRLIHEHLAHLLDRVRRVDGGRQARAAHLRAGPERVRWGPSSAPLLL